MSTSSFEDKVEKQQHHLNGGLKRKNENGIDEQKIEVGIKRVALNDESNSVVSTSSSPKQAEMSPEIPDEDQLSRESLDNTKDSQEILESNSSVSEVDSAYMNHNDYVNMRMLCLVKDASVIVGPKGDTINQIKHETFTKINVSSNRRDIPERVIFVRGPCENVSKAYYNICKYLLAHRIRKTKDMVEMETRSISGSDASSEISPNDSREDLRTVNNEDTEENQESFETEEVMPITVNLLIPHHLMGYIIGKNGSKLKEIEEESTVRLQASPHQLLPSTDRILRVTGSPEAIRIAVLAVTHTINSHKDKLRNKKTIFYQPGPFYSILGKLQFSTQPRLINHYPIPQMNQMNQMNQIQFDNNSMDLNYNTGNLIVNNNANKSNSNNNPINRISPRLPMVMLIPSVDPQDQAMIPPQGFIKFPNNMDSNIMYTAETAANATTFVPNMVLPNVRIVDNSMSSQPMTVVKQEIYIDERFVGNVIGKEGKHINSIKDTTGCSVIFDDRAEGESERRIVIEGTHMGAQAAIMLINNKIEMDKFNMQNKP